MDMKNQAGSSRRCNTMRDKMLNQDRFGKQLSMQFDGGKESLPSKMGSACSLLLWMLMIMYALYKVSILESRRQVDILQTVDKEYFDENYTFGARQGLSIGANVVDVYDQRTFYEPIDWRYGTLSFSIENYAVDEIDNSIKH